MMVTWLETHPGGTVSTANHTLKRHMMCAMEFWLQERMPYTQRRLGTSCITSLPTDRIEMAADFLYASRNDGCGRFRFPTRVDQPP